MRQVAENMSRKQSEGLSALYTIAAVVSQSLDLNALLHVVLETVLRVMDSEIGGIFLYDPESQELSLAVHRGLRDEVIAKVERQKVGKDEVGIASRTAYAKKIIIIDNLSQHPLAQYACDEVERGRGGSMISLPLLAGGHVVGVLQVTTPHPRRFDQDALHLLQKIGSHIGIAIENARLFQLVAKAKQEYEHTFDAIPDLISIHDEAYRVVRANRAVAERLRTTPEEVIGKRCYEVLCGADRPCTSCPLVQVIETGEPSVSEMEWSGRIFSVICYPIVDRKSGLRRAVHIVREVTDQRRLEQEAVARWQAEETNRLKSLFLANASHELRTPLNSILGFAELLQAQTFGPLNAKQQRYVSNIHEGGKHLLALINDLLDLSKVEVGKIGLRPEPIPLRETLEAILELVRSQAVKKGLTLSLEAPSDLPLLSADPVRFKQILYNLLSNAIKFTPANGTVTLIVSTDPAASEVRITVKDSGIGLKPEDLPKLFREFGRLEAGMREPGTGLGLALSKRLVELHGGRIWAESEGEGRGSRFTFIMPLARTAKPLLSIFDPESQTPGQVYSKGE